MEQPLENFAGGGESVGGPMELNYASGSAEWHAGVRVYRMPNADERVAMPLLARQWIVSVGGVLPTVAAMLFFIEVHGLAARERLFALGLSIAWMAVVTLSSGLTRRFYFRRLQDASYKLILDEDRITRHVDGYDDLVVRRDEVVSIYEQPRTLVIRPGSLFRLLGVPRRLEHYDDLRQRLAVWKPISKRRRPLWRPVLQVVFNLGLMPLMVWGWLAPSFKGTLAAVIPLVVIFGWSSYVAWKSPNVKRSARMSMLVLWIMLLPMVLKMLLSLWGPVW